MKKIIFFNGPPRCGKDTASNGLLSHYEKSENVKFSESLKSSLPKFFGISDDYIKVLEIHKEFPLEILLGKTWREVQISLSEHWAKPIFGKDVFGRIASNRIKHSNNEIFFISDSGFYEEAHTLVEDFGIENCLLIRVKREGYDFSSDSRSYWNNIDDIYETAVYNNKDINSLIETCIKEINRWLNNDNSF